MPPILQRLLQHFTNSFYGPKLASFCLFSFFSQCKDKYSIIFTVNDKSLDGWCHWNSNPGRQDGSVWTSIKLFPQFELNFNIFQQCCSNFLAILKNSNLSNLLLNFKVIWQNTWHAFTVIKISLIPQNYGSKVRLGFTIVNYNSRVVIWAIFQSPRLYSCKLWS